MQNEQDWSLEASNYMLSDLTTKLQDWVNFQLIIWDSVSGNVNTLFLNVNTINGSHMVSPVALFTNMV